MTTFHTTGEDGRYLPSKPQVFDPANAVVNAGIVQLNKLSPYLEELPDTARAFLLVAPQESAALWHQTPGTWNEEIEHIRTIPRTLGIHYEGKALGGMPISDRPTYYEYRSYERAWATQITQLWKQACKSGEAVTSGLAMETTPLVHHILSQEEEINVALRQQGGRIITHPDSINFRAQFTASAVPRNGIWPAA
ncbi:MAG: hypothetical protein LRY39_01800 [Alphaproteobacteria bacterium]|nr:hypothetical protein [Alphaproteobacteria bacterium]